MRRMAFDATIRRYLRAMQREYEAAIRGGQHTAELSFRNPLHELFINLAHDLNSTADIDVILEPRNQGRMGRPDWRIQNQSTLGVYGYIEAKGPSSEPFDTTPYQDQINRYLSLGHKLIITDGIDFVICFTETPTVVSIIDKTRMGMADWSRLNVDERFRFYMQQFFTSPAPQQVNEEQLVELVAIRTRNLADDIMSFADLSEDEAIDESERQVISLLSGLKQLVYNHNDPTLRTGSVFADFVAQVVMFCLLYAHRVFCSSTDTPAQKESKIRDYINRDVVDGEALQPFKHLMHYLLNEAEAGAYICRWVDECISFLSYVQMTDEQLMNPDYHRLFELFLTKYDAKVKFDYGAFYTPKVLADFVIRVTNYIVDVTFDGATIYDDGNTIVDACCGTGSFLEEIITHDPNDGAYHLCGLEILPAPYMLANYRMAVVAKQLGQRRLNASILLTNTLCNGMFCDDNNNLTIEGQELTRANRLSSRPIKLIVGNPPCSDSIRANRSADFSVINALMDDFRPPVEGRHGRQNIQKQINNPFMQFIRWSCKKLLDSQEHSVLSIVVPLSFLEAESYKFARKYLVDHFSTIWAASIDADGRTGIRSDSLFHTLQGRAVIVIAKKYGDNADVTEFHYADFSHGSRREKEAMLAADVETLIARFSTHMLDRQTYSFMPTRPFDVEAYNKFWPISGENGQQAIFLKHCSGIKLAPTAIFTHVKAAILKRRSREVATLGAEASRAWFAGQDKPPKEDKLEAFRAALIRCGDTATMDNMLTTNTHLYSFRPYMRINVLLWKDLLQQYARIGGGGTRLRPEIIKAYANPTTIGFAMAHAPKDLNPTLSQFVSFCWYYPDNDMCTRGNSHIYMNQYPDGETGMVSNINVDMLNRITQVLETSEDTAARAVVFYTYAFLCSQVYLDEFEGALFTVHQTDKRARIPVVSDKDSFERMASLGESLAMLERSDYQPENQLCFDYESLMHQVPAGFRLMNSSDLFDEENELLVLSDGRIRVEVPCPTALQKLNISGYDVIKSVWIKFHSYAFTHCDFTGNDMKELLDFLNTLNEHTRIVSQIDDVARRILDGSVELLLPTMQ